MSNKKLRMAFVGSGEGGLKAYSALKTNDEIDIRAFCEVDELKTVPMAKCYQTLEMLFKNEKIDAVYIATPNNTHISISNQCIKYGKHVLIEKPLSTTISEVGKINKKTKLIIGIALKKRFGDWIPLYKKWFSCDQSPINLNIKWYIKPPTTPWRYDYEVSGGGVLVDLGSHIIDLCTFLCGSIEKIEGIAYFSPNAPYIDTYTKLRLHFKGSSQILAF